ncbi:MAG: ABC transporter transmembrane domain-containing protein, partial [Chromatiales bacterium]|nr:ABC transporter transmembrane domain-containing protein [Chromatiales bacterium]
MADPMVPDKDIIPPVEVYRRLLSHSLAYWPLMAVAIVAMVATAAAETGFAAIMRPLLDGSFVERDPDVIRWIPYALVGIFIVRGGSGFFSGYFMSYIGRQVVKELRAKMFDQLLRMPVSYYDNASSGQLLSRLTYNVEQVAQASTDSITVLVRDSLTVIGLVAWMFYLNWTLALSIIVVGPVIAGIVAYITRRFRRISRRIQGSMGDVSHVAEEMIDGHRVVKIFGGEDYERAHFEAANERNRALHMKMVATHSASVPLIQFILAVVLAFIVYLATLDSMQDTVTVGTFVSFMTAMLMLLSPIKRLTSVNMMLQKGIAAGQNIFLLLDEPVEQDHGTLRIERARGEIEFRDVRFAYTPEKGDVLKGISFRAEPGRTVAFVGRSGSGKSTLVHLLPRFYLPREGRVLLDGADIDQYRLSDL